MEQDIDKICEIKDKFDKIYAAHHEELDGYREICEENRIKDSQSIRSDYESEVNISDNRLLKIGFVGRVKAGKSSIINAFVFNGKDILPKAATPMTAALTELSYGEKLKVTIDFFEPEDIAALEKMYQEYLKVFNDEKERAVKRLRERKMYSESEIMSKATKSATSMVAESNSLLAGAYEQYKMIKERNIQVPSESQTFEPKDLSEIAAAMDDYVGSSGKYMPVTRSVKLELPIEFLSGVTIVDTPGFNDPVPSRDKRAVESLRECDVIFILSPAGQFLSAEDTAVIEKIRNKEGIREIFAVASKADTELSGSEKDKNAGILDNVLSSLKANFTASLNKNAVIAKLEAEKKEVILSSGMAYSMLKQYDNKANWNEDTKYYWEQLRENYPDNFSDNDDLTSKNSLQKLANIDILFERIAGIKSRKNEIFQTKIADFITAKKNALSELPKVLTSKIDAYEAKVEGLSLEELIEEIKNLENNTLVLKNGISMAVENSVDKWYEEWLSIISSEISEATESARNLLNTASHDEERQETEWTTERYGFLWLKKREVPHTYTYTTTVYEQYKIKNSINGFIDFVQDLFNKPIICGNILKHKLASQIAQKWAEKATGAILDTDEIANIAVRLVHEFSHKAADYASKEIKDVVSKSMDYGASQSGLDKAYEDLRYACTRAKSVFVEYLNDVSDDIKKCHLEDKLLDKLNKELAMYKKDYNNKQAMHEQNKRIKKELNDICEEYGLFMD